MIKDNRSKFEIVGFRLHKLAEKLSAATKAMGELLLIAWSKGRDWRKAKNAGFRGIVTTWIIYDIGASPKSRALNGAAKMGNGDLRILCALNC